jgi:hypothetical protein
VPLDSTFKGFKTKSVSVRTFCMCADGFNNIWLPCGGEGKPEENSETAFGKSCRNCKFFHKSKQSLYFYFLNKTA